MGIFRREGTRASKASYHSLTAVALKPDDQAFYSSGQTCLSGPARNESPMYEITASRDGILGFLRSSRSGVVGFGGTKAGGQDSGMTTWYPRSRHDDRRPAAVLA